MPKLVPNLQEQIEHLRSELENWKRTVATRDEELHRKDTILMNMTKAMKAPNAPPAPRESPETVAESTGNGDVVIPDEDERAKPWLRRWFGG